jgi:hypothetical protein
MYICCEFNLFRSNFVCSLCRDIIMVDVMCKCLFVVGYRPSSISCLLVLRQSVIICCGFGLFDVLYVPVFVCCGMSSFSCIVSVCAGTKSVYLL